MCCCLPINCLRILVFIASGLLIAVGGVLLWFGYDIDSQEIVTLIKDEIEGADAIGIVVMVTGGVLVLGGVFGFLGACKRNCCCLTIFVIVSILVGVILVAFGVGAIILIGIVEDEIGDEQKCQDTFSDVDENLALANDVFCTELCPCLIDAGTTVVLTANQDKTGFGASNVKECDPCSYIDGYTPTEIATLDAFTENQFNKNSAIGDCTTDSDDYIDTYFQDASTYFDLLKWIEETLDCSGLCTPMNLYYFSDVSRGTPTDNCTDALTDWVDENFTIAGAVLISIGGYLLLMLFVPCSICCHKNRKEIANKGKSPRR